MIRSSIFSKTKILSALFLTVGGMSFLAFKISQIESKNNQLSTIERGLDTCYARVNQTYTAKMIQDQSMNYLSQSFQALTEDCFAEVAQAINEGLKEEMPKTAKKLSTLASSVHWFHESLISNNKNSQVKDGDFGSRFEKIESLRDEVLEEIDFIKVANGKESLSLKHMLLAATIFLFAGIIFELSRRTRKNLSILEKDSQALKEMEESGGVYSIKIGEIIKNALEDGEYYQCAKFFTNYYLHQVFEKNNRENLNRSFVTPSSLGQKTFPSQHTNQRSNQEDVIEAIWENEQLTIDIDGKMLNKNPTSSEIGESATENEHMSSTCLLDQSVNSLIEQTSGKLFSKGIGLDLKLVENTKVVGDEETILCFLFSAISYLINSAETNDQAARLKITMLKLGDVLALDMSISGKSIPLELLKERKGLDLGGDIQNSTSLDLELKICLETAALIDGSKCVLDHSLNQMGEVVGPRIKMIFKLATERQVTLSSLHVGKKAEILESILVEDKEIQM